jgi:hypothetical protein
VLPARTTTLVAWPMFSGCLAVAGVWWITAALVFRPGGVDAPLWLPAAAIALFLASFQAVMWTPFSQRWLQLVLMVFVIMAPMAAALVVIALDIPGSEPVVAAMFTALIPVAYFAAVLGVARARRGQPYDWRGWSRFVEWLTTFRSPATHPFRSAARAQLWFECRAHAWTFPLFLGCILVAFPGLPLIEPENVALGWRVLGLLLAAPLMIALMAGNLLGMLHDPFSKGESATFLLTRPVSSVSLVRSKLAAAALGTAVTWLLVLSAASLVLLRPGFVDSVVELARPFPLWKAVGAPLLVLVLLVLLTWTNMVSNLWISLTGRAWVGNAFGFGAAGLVFTSIGVGLLLLLRPELRGPAQAAVPWLMGTLVVLKALVAIGVLRGLGTRKLLSPTMAAGAVVLWALVVAGLCCLAYSLTPSELWSPGQTLAGIVLAIPFSRLIGAPLALDWNRHR